MKKIFGILIIILVSFFLGRQFPIRAQDSTTSAQLAVPSISLFESEIISQNSAEKRSPVRLESAVKAVYHSNEKVQVKLFNQDLNQVDVKIKDEHGGNVSTEVTENDDLGVSTIKISPPAHFKPGKYKMILTDQTGQIIEQDFLWGVLAINPNKSIYQPDDVSKLSMAVLDDQGKMVCDAKLILKISGPSGQVDELTTENGKITINPECSGREVTLKADYQTEYKPDTVGNYSLELTAVTKDGTNTINDRFEVKTDIDFDVERISATRIFPLNVYPMTINLEVKADFKGNIYETVPASFDISPPGEGIINYSRITQENDLKKIIWQVDLKKGDKIIFGYQFKTPNISPQFYLTGPLTMATLTDLVYTEVRQWQIAVDAITQIRQEINIIDSPVTIGGTDAAIVNLDTTKYSGTADYFFEIIAKVGSGTLMVNLSTGNTDTVGIGITNTNFVLVRKEFTPEPGSFDYRLNLVNGTTPIVTAARIIILQTDADITDTQTQIEIGNREVGLTMSTGVKQPIMQAIGTSAASTGAAVTPVWPAHQSGDIALLFVESVGGTTVSLSTPAGFTLVANSPQATGVGVSGTALTVFWARANSSSMANPVVHASVNHLYAQILTYRNVIETGNPWDTTVGTTKPTASTTTTWGAFTTTVDKTLIVFAAARDTDSAAAAWGLISNSNIFSSFERIDGGTASGNGGGLKISDAMMLEAGVGGVSTATVTSSINATLLIALKGGNNPDSTSLESPKYWQYNSDVWDGTQTVYVETVWKKTDVGTLTPRFQAIGTSAASTGAAVTPVWPAHQSGDIALLFVESVGGTTVSLSTPAGFTLVANSPQATGVGVSGTALTVFWARANSSSMANPVVHASVNHLYAQILTYRNVIETGNPWDTTVGTTKPTASTTTTWGAFTTTVDDTLIVFSASRDNDSAAVAWGMINDDAVLWGSTGRVDGGTTSGNGGGIIVSDAILPVAGSCNTSTATVTSSINATLLIALKGKVDATTKVSISVQEDDGSFGVWSDVASVTGLNDTSGIVTRSRSSSFVPNTGKNYRLVKSINNSEGHTLDIYNAKILIDQTDATAISKLEPQYLLLNTASSDIGHTLGYTTLWDSSEWSHTANVYKHAMDAVGAGTNAQLVDIDNSNNSLTNSSVTGANQVISSELTMPSSSHHLDTWLVNAGTHVNASRILVQVNINASIDSSNLEQLLRHGGGLLNGLRQKYTF